MPLIDNMVEVRVGGRNSTYYKNLGYDVPFIGKGQSISMLVKSCDVPPTSKITLLDFICDKCGKQFKRSSGAWHSSMKRTGYTDTLCEECCKGNPKRSMMRIYGVSAGSQIPGAKEKRIQTNLQKYGVDYPRKLKEVVEKSKATCLERYGVDSYSKLPESRERSKQLFHQNGLVSCSNAQKHIAEIVNGNVNELFHGYYLDIFVGDWLDIEYDGSGHDMRVKMGKMTQEMFDAQERKRYAVVHKHGIKTITIKGNKQDVLPDDDVLLQDINEAIQVLKSDNQKSYHIDYSNLS